MEITLGIIIGALLASSLIYFANFINNSPKQIRLRLSQSHINSMYPPTLNIRDYVETQSIKHSISTQMRILFTEENAYWIKDNQVYKADLENGAILEDSAKVLDIIGMDKVELDEVIFIVEKLTEGKSNDYRNSWNEEL